MLADWTIGIIPYFIVRKLNIPQGQRRLVICILALGSIGSAATVIRVPLLTELKDSYEGPEGDFLCKYLPADASGVALLMTDCRRNSRRHHLDYRGSGRRHNGREHRNAAAFGARATSPFQQMQHLRDEYQQRRQCDARNPAPGSPTKCAKANKNLLRKCSEHSGVERDHGDINAEQQKPGRCVNGKEGRYASN
jgi:hypothetical protein